MWWGATCPRATPSPVPGPHLSQAPPPIPGPPLHRDVGRSLKSKATLRGHMASGQSLGHTDMSFAAALILLLLFTAHSVLAVQVDHPSRHTDARTTEARGFCGGGTEAEPHILGERGSQLCDASLESTPDTHPRPLAGSDRIIISSLYHLSVHLDH